MHPGSKHAFSTRQNHRTVSLCDRPSKHCTLGFSLYSLASWQSQNKAHALAGELRIALEGQHTSLCPVHSPDSRGNVKALRSLNGCKKETKQKKAPAHPADDGSEPLRHLLQPGRLLGSFRRLDELSQVGCQEGAPRSCFREDFQQRQRSELEVLHGLRMFFPLHPPHQQRCFLCLVDAS